MKTPEEEMDLIESLAASDIAINGVDACNSFM